MHITVVFGSQGVFATLLEFGFRKVAENKSKATWKTGKRCWWRRKEAWKCGIKGNIIMSAKSIQAEERGRMKPMI